MREFVVLGKCRWIATEEFAEKLDLGTAGLKSVRDNRLFRPAAAYL